MGYAEAPWIFTGRAIYQLNLVKSSEARKYIPDDFKLVELFGYTLGGFYLARYEDSPVGAFDELVALAGLVWNPPTSCAWAARVYVSNREARNHGLRHVGLPSRCASFHSLPDAAAVAVSSRASSSSSSSKPHNISGSSSRQSWWQPQPPAGGSSGGSVEPTGAVVEVHNLERGARGLRRPVCSFLLPPMRLQGFLGPRLRLALPSFSGGTPDHPGLLKYSCDLATSIMPVAPLRVTLPAPADDSAVRSNGRESGELMDTVLAARPLLALAFSNMHMTVQEPQKLVQLAARGAPASGVLV